MVEPCANTPYEDLDLPFLLHTLVLAFRSHACTLRGGQMQDLPKMETISTLSTELHGL